MSGSSQDSGHSWLVVGHGAVGSALARRIDEVGDTILIYDPAPRAAIVTGRRVEAIEPSLGTVDFCLSCVSPAAAALVPELVRPLIGETTVFLDWNTISPEEKRALGRALPCEVIDVALLDSLEGGAGPNRVAISGRAAAERKSVLERIGFRVDLAGDACGDAALLKFARSVFMKGLEALTLEYLAVASNLDGGRIVDASIANNLGEQFTEFMELLVRTNRRHAERRASELADAVGIVEARGGSLTIAPAAVALLERCAALWKETGAPTEEASVDELVDYLARSL